MMFLTLEDLDGTLDVIIFPDVYRQARGVTSSQAPFLVTGTMEMNADHDEPFLRAERVATLK